MRKTELEVIRINEDVITTSCKHEGADHFYSEVIEYMFSNPVTLHGDYYEGSKTVTNSNYKEGVGHFVSELKENTWYYYTDELELEICNGDHSEYERELPIHYYD